MVNNSKNIDKIDKGIIVIDDFLQEDYLIELVSILDHIDWDYCYSQKGSRSAIQFKQNSYTKNIKEFQIIEKIREFIFSEKNISHLNQVINAVFCKNYIVILLFENIRYKKS